VATQEANPIEKKLHNFPHLFGCFDHDNQPGDPEG